MSRQQRGPHMLVTTSVKSYSQRVGQSGMGALIGIVIVGGSAFLLWWNEHRALEQEQSLGEMKTQVVEASPMGVNPKHEGKWVHATGPLTSEENIHDYEYDIPPASSSSSSASSSSFSPPPPSAPSFSSCPPSLPVAQPAPPFSSRPPSLPVAQPTPPSFLNPAPSSLPPAYEDVIRGSPRRSPFIRLRRETQMYQWMELNQRSASDRVGGKQEVKTTTTYKKDWSSTHQDTARFKLQDGHENPPCIPTPSATFQPTEASVAGFSVPGSITAEIPERAVTPGSVEVNGQAARRVGEWIYLSASSNRPPQVGDVRVRFFAVPQNEVVSVVGRQRDGWLVGEGGRDSTVAPLCRPGHWTANELLESASRNLRMVTIALRALGVVGGVAGFRMFLDPVVTVAAVVPILSTFLGAGAFAVSIPAGLGLSLPTILAAWLHARLNYGLMRGLVKSMYLTYLVFFIIKLGQYLAKIATSAGRAGLTSARQLGTWWQTLWALYRK